MSSTPAEAIRADEESIDSIVIRALRKESVAAVSEQVAGDPPAHEPLSGTESESPGGPVGPSGGWSSVVIQVFAIALISSGITLTALKLAGLLAPAPVRVVTFDVLKYENAERAAAMQLMGQGGAGAVAPMLSYASKRLSAAIQAAAGRGTLVVLSQAVVQGETRNITDQVLESLGLPTKVPTADPLKVAGLKASTMLPAIAPNPESPLSQMLNEGEHAKSTSIVP